MSRFKRISLWVVALTAVFGLSCQRSAERQTAGSANDIPVGVYAALSEGLCSGATYMQVARDGKIAVGSSNHTSFLRPVAAGVVTANARALHSGRTSWVWECEFTTEEGKRCAISRVTLAVIDPR